MEFQYVIFLTQPKDENIGDYIFDTLHTVVPQHGRGWCCGAVS